MKIALYNLEPKIVNTAMMQVSQYHKSKGDEVRIYNHLFHEIYNKVYAFSIFDFTDKGYVREDMVCGGTGFDIKSRLPKEIEDSDYDWSLYPDCEYSILWFSRGCIRNCDFCVVRDKEGLIHSVKPKNLNPNGKEIHVYDNNFFANPKWLVAIKWLDELDQPVIFSQGVDIRKLTIEHCKALQEIKLKYIYVAWDNPNDNLVDQIIMLKKYVKAYKIGCFVLIGYNSTEEQDLFRVNSIKELDIDAFVMPIDKKDPYQKKFSRWVNRPEIFQSTTWKEYNEKN